MISGSTRLAGLVGYPARYSLSPQLHNAAYDAMGIEIAYLVLPVEPDSLRAAIEGIRTVDAIGLSVTVPHKHAVVSLLDDLDPPARQLDAVNCIHFVDGTAIGYNTDGDGFVRSLREANFEPNGADCVVVGAGGAARAVVEALGRAGAAHVRVLARNHDAAQRTARLAQGRGVVVENLDIGTPDLFVNATPLGMDGESLGTLPPAADRLTDKTTVADLVYSPLVTALLAHAAQLGCTTVGGTGMLLHQAAEQVRIWTGAEPPIDVMRTALERAMRS